ncbi:MAG: hypothetical protein J7L66_02660 [Anaerolineaceae bacterium]|nr:hypothetical protein [Anaerolineaceae bacterium]
MHKQNGYLIGTARSINKPRRQQTRVVLRTSQPTSSVASSWVTLPNLASSLLSVNKLDQGSTITVLASAAFMRQLRVHERLTKLSLINACSSFINASLKKRKAAFYLSLFRSPSRLGRLK